MANAKQLEQIGAQAGVATTEMMSGLEWTSRYGVYTTTVAGWVDITFSFEASAYKIKIAGRILKTRGTSPSDAAEIAVNALKIWNAKLTDCLKFSY